VESERKTFHSLFIWQRGPEDWQGFRREQEEAGVGSLIETTANVPCIKEGKGKAMCVPK